MPSSRIEPAILRQLRLGWLPYGLGMYSMSLWASLEMGSVAANFSGPVRGAKDPVAAENNINDSWNSRYMERNARLKRAHVAGMDSEVFSGLKVFHN